MSIEEYTCRFDELTIGHSALAYAMGYPDGIIPPHIRETVEDVLSHGGELCDIRGGLALFDHPEWDSEKFILHIGSTAFDLKKIIFQQIKKSTGIALFVCTAGPALPEKAGEFAAHNDLLTGYVYDVFGSVVVEAAMDRIQGHLAETMSAKGLHITNRYSPGYCGWVVGEQQKLFGLLPEKFCGVELTDTSLMKPIKSVSGLIGIGEKVKKNPYACAICDMSNCLYRNLQHR